MRTNRYFMILFLGLAVASLPAGVFARLADFLLPKKVAIMIS